MVEPGSTSRPSTAAGPATTTAFLRVRDLSVAYGEAPPVLDGVSLDVQRGRFVSVLGPSGCGKTTMLKALAGFIPVAGGRVEMDERDLLQVPPARRDVGFVFQNYALFPHMSVQDNVAYGLASRRQSKAERRARVAEMLDLVGLSSFARRRPTELSGGQQQRVAIARALAIRPRLLLMDEPLSNLDAKLRVEMREELRNLQRRIGVTTLFVTHDQEEAMTISDQLVLLNRGVVEQVGTPEELYSSPRTPFVADFIGGGTVFTGTVTAGPDGGPVLPSDDGPIPVPSHLTGGEITVVVREDRVRLHPGPGAAGYPGTVEQAAFLGSAWRYRVRLESGRILHAEVSSQAGAGIPEGTSVAVQWTPEDLTVVRRT